MPAPETSANGFWIEEPVLSPDECDGLLVALSTSVGHRGRAGARHLMAHTAVAALAADPRLLRIARGALGPGAVPYRATLFEKSGRANWLVVWHQDTALPLEAYVDAPEWGPWSRKGGHLYAHAPAWALERIVALRVHLDASTSENGPLRVIPGSHAKGLLEDDEVFARARRGDDVACLVDRGGVLAMRPLLIHASSKARGDEPRRVLHLEYADSLELRPGIRLAVA
jgi:ectoine hydroxylase-related dioxygenase (phytanoyl-CoA dioxygenase family)